MGGVVIAVAAFIAIILPAIAILILYSLLHSLSGYTLVVPVPLVVVAIVDVDVVVAVFIFK